MTPADELISIMDKIRHIIGEPPHDLMVSMGSSHHLYKYYNNPFGLGHRGGLGHQGVVQTPNNDWTWVKQKSDDAISWHVPTWMNDECLRRAGLVATIANDKNDRAWPPYLYRGKDRVWLTENIPLLKKHHVYHPDIGSGPISRSVEDLLGYWRELLELIEPRTESEIVCGAVTPDPQSELISIMNSIRDAIGRPPENLIILANNSVHLYSYYDFPFKIFASDNKPPYFWVLQDKQKGNKWEFVEWLKQECLKRGGVPTEKTIGSGDYLWDRETDVRFKEQDSVALRKQCKVYNLHISQSPTSMNIDDLICYWRTLLDMVVAPQEIVFESKTSADEARLISIMESIRTIIGKAPDNLFTYNEKQALASFNNYPFYVYSPQWNNSVYKWVLVKNPTKGGEWEYVNWLKEEWAD